MENTLSLKSILMIVVVILLLKPLLNSRKENMSDNKICKSLNFVECAKFYCSLEMCKKYQDEGYPKNVDSINMEKNGCLDKINQFKKKDEIEKEIRNQAMKNNLCKLKDMGKHLEEINRVNEIAIKNKLNNAQKIAETKVQKTQRADPVADLMKKM